MSDHADFITTITESAWSNLTQIERQQIREALAALERELELGRAFMEAHDAFIELQAPDNAFAMKDRADAFRAALAPKEDA